MKSGELFTKSNAHPKMYYIYNEKVLKEYSPFLELPLDSRSDFLHSTDFQNVNNLSIGVLV